MKHCPMCGSTDVRSSVFYRPSIWECSNCGYEGAFIVEGGTLPQGWDRAPETNVVSSIGWKENPVWTIGTVKWTNGSGPSYG